LQDLKFVGMMQYDGDLLLPANYLVPPPEIHKTSGEFLVHNGISTFACSETQKFGHVTFFWNGNRSGYFDSNLETYLEVGALCMTDYVGSLASGSAGHAFTLSYRVKLQAICFTVACSEASSIRRLQSSK
jgi:hypothetical protein